MVSVDLQKNSQIRSDAHEHMHTADANTDAKKRKQCVKLVMATMGIKFTANQLAEHVRDACHRNPGIKFDHNFLELIEVKAT